MGLCNSHVFFTSHDNADVLCSIVELTGIDSVSDHVPITLSMFHFLMFFKC